MPVIPCLSDRTCGPRTLDRSDRQPDGHNHANVTANKSPSSDSGARFACASASGAPPSARDCRVHRSCTHMSVPGDRRRRRQDAGVSQHARQVVRQQIKYGGNSDAAKTVRQGDCRTGAGSRDQERAIRSRAVTSTTAAWRPGGSGPRGGIGVLEDAGIPGPRRSTTPQPAGRKPIRGACHTVATESTGRRIRSTRRRQDQALRRGRQGRSSLQLRGHGRRRRRQGQSRLGLRQGQRSAAERREGTEDRHARA